MRYCLALACVSLALSYEHALAEMAPRVRPASPVQQIASEVLPPGNGDHPETPDFCVIPDSGNIVAVWRADRLDLNERDTHGIWWRYFSSSLEPLNDPVPVGPDEEGFGSRIEIFPACIPTVEGNFFIVWEHRVGDFPDRADVLGQLLSAAGAALTDETVLTEDTSVEEYMPGVVRTADGNLLLVWSSYYDDFNRYRVFMRRFGVTGTPLGGDQYLVGTGNEAEPNRLWAQVTGDGVDVLAAWSEVVPAVKSTPAHLAIFARSLSKDDAVALMISEESATNDLCSDLAMNASGGVALWVSADKALRIRQLDADAQPTGPVRTLDEVQDGFIADGPSVAAAPDGSSYFVVWGIQDDEAEETVLWAQLLTSQASPVGAPYRIARLDSSGGYRNKLRFPGVAYVSADSVVVGWEYFRQPPGPVANIELHVQLFEIGSMDHECGDVDDDGFATASDALTVLKGAVGLIDCVACFCDANGSGAVSSSDALTVLRASVDLPASLKCPVCDPQ